MCIPAYVEKRLKLYCKLVWHGTEPLKARRIVNRAYPPEKRMVQHRDVTTKR
jgi:hypothetical protein